MAHILISSNRLKLAQHWMTLLHEEHETVLFNSLKKVITHVLPIDTCLIIVDSELIDSDISVLTPLLQMQLKILIVGNGWSDDRQIEALTYGCSGYCEAETADKLLSKAVNQLLLGDVWIQRHLTPQLIKTLAGLNKPLPKAQDVVDNEHKLALLSLREMEVAKLIKTGENNKGIAAALNISERTVKAHLTSIFSKLNIPDRLHLALFLKGTKPPK